MRSLFILILLFPCLSFGTEITCYSGGKSIYHGYVHNIRYTNNFIVFTENKTNLIKFAFMDCFLLTKNK